MVKLAKCTLLCENISDMMKPVVLLTGAAVVQVVKRVVH